MTHNSEIPDREWYFKHSGTFSIFIGSLLAVISGNAAVGYWRDVFGQTEYFGNEAFWAFTLFLTLTAALLSAWSVSALYRYLRLRSIPHGGFIRLDDDALHYHTLKNGSGSLRFTDIKYIGYYDANLLPSKHIDRINCTFFAEYLLSQDNPDSADLRRLEISIRTVYSPALHPFNPLRRPLTRWNDFCEAVRRRCPHGNLLTDTERDILRYRDELEQEKERTRVWLEKFKR